MSIDLTTRWSGLPLAVLDFETTGIDPLACMPVSVACVLFEGGQEVDHFYSLLNPGCAIPAEATAIHKITNEMVANAPVLEEVAGDILRVAKDALPVAYNSPFDRAILHRFVMGTDCPMFDPAQEWCDPLVVVRGVDRFVKGRGKYKLENACKRWDVEMDDAHNALSDARAAGRLMLGMIGVLGDMSAEKLVAAVVKRRAEQERDFEAYRKRMETKETANG